MRLGSYARLLILSLSLPALAHAVGLGTMRVDSRLNEPLSAQVDILGATPEELKTLSATLADADSFERYKLERPAVLATAKFMVAFDALGRPVLNIRSSDAITEPLVDLLIDLRWGKEELLRDYTLLLDPAPLAAPAPTAAATAKSAGDASAVPSPVSELSEIVLTSGAVSAASLPAPARAASARVASTGAQHRIVAHDTLRNIARRAGARSAADQQRMMLAIYQANPQAFAGNINRLHRGALLKIPSLAEARAIESAQVDQEIAAQMTAWRQGRPAARQAAIAPELDSPKSAPARVSTPQSPDMSTVLSAMNQLDGRVQFLQQTLGETTKELATATARISHVERNAVLATPGIVAPAATENHPVTSKSRFGAMAWALALLVGALAYVCGRYLPGWAHNRKSVASKPLDSEEPTIESPAADPDAINAVLSAMAETEALWVGKPIAPNAPAAATAAAAAPAAKPVQETSVTIEITQPVEIDVDAIEAHEAQVIDEPDTVIMEMPECPGR